MKNRSTIFNKYIKSKFSIAFLMLFTVILIASCKKDVLNTKPLAQLSDEVVWKDPSLMETYIINTYRILPHGFQFGSRRLFSVSDESKARGSAAYSVINAGNISPSSLGPLDYWIGTSSDPGYYKCITQCNVFLDKVNETDFDSTLKNRMIGEIKTLRAFSYFRL